MDTKVYTKKQSVKLNGKFEKGHSTVESEGFKLSNDMVESHNKNFAITGSFYDLDLKKTVSYREAADLNRKDKKLTPIKWDSLPKEK